MSRVVQTLIGRVLLLMLMVVAFPSNIVNAQAPATITNNDALFQDFGGQAGLDKVIDDFIGVWKADPRINRVLVDADVEHLRSMLQAQFSQLTGGPTPYKGLDMKAAHEAMGLRNTDFNALAEDLQNAMDKNNISSRAQNKLLSKLAPMEHDIVTK